MLGASATPYEVTLAVPTVDPCYVAEEPKHLIGDKSYDSDGLDASLAARGIEMVAPNRRNRRHPTQGGQTLRRYRRRWTVERL